MRGRAIAAVPEGAAPPTASLVLAHAPERMIQPVARAMGDIPGCLFRGFTSSPSGPWRARWPGGKPAAGRRRHATEGA
ncbi:hypothetical protein RAA17_15720 [Komagataeibacter rhaeticus]|nr:hypothetical protein [Komagataeibacter rhaeticus]